MDLGTQNDLRVAFTVNATPVTVRANHPHLLAALREELDITSPKDGCSPTGQCGCCTVWVNGKAVVSCQTPLSKVAGGTVTTLEGVDEEERNRYSQAFAACGGLQCGFCIPGIVVRAKAQVDKKGAALQRSDMAKHLGAHLCRCTGYVKILDAVLMVARGEVPVLVKPGGVGTSTVKYEAEDLALGDRGYIDDIRIPACCMPHSYLLNTLVPTSPQLMRLLHCRCLVSAQYLLQPTFQANSWLALSTKTGQ